MYDQKVLSNRYEIGDLVARGGMARVYRARDRLLGRTVAVKVLNPEFASDPGFVERFRREARSAAALSHPNIVSVYDFDSDGSMHYLVMEFIDGRTLRDLLKSGGRLHYRRAAEIASEIALALEAAHRNGVVHRDIKPGNIMITHNGEVKVTDFGIARAAGTAEALTQAGSVLGTASYLAPEQAEGRPIDARSDLYSLGVVLYEMLTGSPPFKADSPLALALKHVKDIPTPPSQLTPDIPPSLEAIVLKALSKAPEARYRSAQEMYEDLTRALRGRPVHATADVEDAAGTEQIDTENPQGPPAAKRTWPFVVVVGLLLALLLYGLYLLGVSLGVLGGPSLVTVPDVVGKNFDPGAKQQLEGMGLRVVASYRPSSPEETGKVLAQDPLGGTRILPSTEVRLVVGEGPGTATVPNVVGKSREEARQALETAGFKVGSVEERPDPNVPEGIVTSQDPKADSRVTKGTPVNLVVSQGPEKVVVPDVTGTSRSQAGRLLSAAGLQVGTVSEEASDQEVGIVIRQTPPAGSSAPKGSAVDLVISTGPPPKKIPSVIGQTLSEATAKLSSEGFSPVVGSCFSADLSKTGKVVSQSPPAGSEAQKGTSVSIVVAQSSDPSATPC